MSAPPLTNGQAFAASIYRAMANDQLAQAIGKLERFVKSLDRAGTAKRIADDYRSALDLARAERDRRTSA